MFTFPKHVSHLVWQLRMTCCVSIVDAIGEPASNIFLFACLFFFLAGQYDLVFRRRCVYRKCINAPQHPLVELTGAALIIPSPTWKQ